MTGNLRIGHLPDPAQEEYLPALRRQTRNSGAQQGKIFDGGQLALGRSCSETSSTSSTGHWSAMWRTLSARPRSFATLMAMRRASTRGSGRWWDSVLQQSDVGFLRYVVRILGHAQALLQKMDERIVMTTDRVLHRQRLVAMLDHAVAHALGGAHPRCAFQTLSATIRMRPRKWEHDACQSSSTRTRGTLERYSAWGQIAAWTGNYLALRSPRQRCAPASPPVSRCRHATPTCTRPVPSPRDSAPNEYRRW